MNDFEKLLNAKAVVNDDVNGFNKMLDKRQEEYQPVGPVARQKADKSAKLFDLIKMIDALVKLTMPNAEFIPDERKIHSMDVMKNIDKPIISYRVIERVSKLEKKPRVREEFEDKNSYTGEKTLGTVYGQKFKCLIEFDIVGSVYSEAEEVMNNFEELMFKYVGFFKKNGVAELIFEKHLTDDNFDNLRESYSVRSLQYYVEVEKLFTVFKHEIEEIELLAQKLMDEEE